jgi:hypothetical protein
MLHSLKFSYRTLRKSPQFTILNLAGLSIGLACVFLIGLWIYDEESTDHFHKNDQRLYQVMLNVKVVDKILTQPQTPGLLAPSFAKEMPEVEYGSFVALSILIIKLIFTAPYKHTDGLSFAAHPTRERDWT